MNKLLLVDGNAVLHRAYYALPDWRNRSGEATAGVYGFLSMLLGAIEQLKPTHLAITFDTPQPTFRHSMYVGYQTNREKDRQVSDDIWGQIEKLKTVFQLLNLPVYTLEGFEADDVIGTLCRQAINSDELTPNPSLNQREGERVDEVIIVTGDRDLMQLVDEHTFLFMPQKGLSDNQIIDIEKVKEKLGVRPDQVVDYKALVGDSSDNYPGVTGIGPKSAIDLISNYSNFSNIYENLVDIKESVRQKLIDGYEGGKLSQQLAMIRRDAPITLEIEKCILPTKQKFAEVFRELNYKSLVSRMTGEKEEKNKDQIGLFD